MKKKWTSEAVVKLVDFLNKKDTFRVELRGCKVIELNVEGFRLAGSNNWQLLEEYYPQDFKIFVKEPIKNWWKNKCEF